MSKINTKARNGVNERLALPYSSVREAPVTV